MVGLHLTRGEWKKNSVHTYTFFFVRTDSVTMCVYTLESVRKARTLSRGVRTSLRCLYLHRLQINNPRSVFAETYPNSVPTYRQSHVIGPEPIASNRAQIQTTIKK